MFRSRMAANESAAVAAGKTYAEAQGVYRKTDWDEDGVYEFAQTLKGALNLVDAALASAEGPPGLAQPKAGYVFKVLKSQGPHAPGGRKSYVDANGKMTMGYALVACPASYDGTGRNTFIVNQTGTVYQKDLGSNTEALFNAMTEYDPGPGWVVAE